MNTLTEALLISLLSVPFLIPIFAGLSARIFVKVRKQFALAVCKKVYPDLYSEYLRKEMSK